MPVPPAAAGRLHRGASWHGLALGAFLLVFGWTRHAAADRIEDLGRIAAGDPDEKARIAAVVGLGRLKDRRGVPALIRALADKSPLVRGLAATALGYIGDPQAIPALERTLSDASQDVRDRAREALGSLRVTPAPERVPRGVRIAPKERPRLGTGHRPARVSVKATASRAGGGDLVPRLQQSLVSLLEDSPDVTLDPRRGNGKAFVLDASITSLERSKNGPWMEVSCQVKVTISTPQGRILSIVTGTAKVQTPRRRYRPSMDRALQLDAVDNAVRGAYQNLILFLARQIATK